MSCSRVQHNFGSLNPSIDAKNLKVSTTASDSLPNSVSNKCQSTNPQTQKCNRQMLIVYKKTWHGMFILSPQNKNKNFKLKKDSSYHNKKLSNAVHPLRSVTIWCHSPLYQVHIRQSIYPESCLLKLQPTSSQVPTSTSYLRNTALQL